MNKKEKKTATIASLTTGRRSDKRYIGQLERIRAKLELNNARLSAELEASRRECGQLKDSELKRDLAISDLRLQIYNFQRLDYYKDQVTSWKENGEDDLFDSHGLLVEEGIADPPMV